MTPYINLFNLQHILRVLDHAKPQSHNTVGKSVPISSIGMCIRASDYATLASPGGNIWNYKALWW